MSSIATTKGGITEKSGSRNASKSALPAPYADENGCSGKRLTPSS